MGSLGQDIKKLGFGLMRLPMIGEDVDIEQTKKMVDLFLSKGFTYFDTAYGYLGGKSEMAIKTALVDRYPRESYQLATKLPAWAGAKTAEEAQGMLATSLARTGAGYFDFYLLHNLGDNRTEAFDRFGIWDFLRRKRDEGVIKHLGFSFHDTYQVFTQILNDYDWDFVQIQLNYLDWQNQGAEQLYRELEKRNLPVMVMEPVRGGYLATIDEQRAKPFLEMEPNRSIASWAVRWVASLPQVAVVLSGMSDEQQLKDNVATMTNFEPMNEQELQAVAKVVEEIRKVNEIPCTGCRYCMDCPMGVDIPEIFAIYSRYKIFEKEKSFVDDYKAVVEHGNGAEHCVRCMACTTKCPQMIAIPDKLEMIAKLYEEKKAKVEAEAAAAAK